MVNIHQITVQIQVLISTHLNCGIRCLGSRRTWWKGEFGKDTEGREVDEGDGLGSELLRVGRKDNLLDEWVRGLRPVGGEWCHFSDDRGVALLCLCVIDGGVSLYLVNSRD